MGFSEGALLQMQALVRTELRTELGEMYKTLCTRIDNRFDDLAKQQIQGTTELVAGPIGIPNSELVTRLEQLGALLLHGMLPTDVDGSPSRVGIQQLAELVDQIGVLVSEVPPMAVGVEDIRLLLRGGQLSITISPPPVGPPGVVTTGMSQSAPPASDVRVAATPAPKSSIEDGEDPDTAVTQELPPVPDEPKAT